MPVQGWVWLHKGTCYFPPLSSEGSLCTLPTLQSFVIDGNDGHPFIWESFSINRALAKLLLSFAFQSLVKSSLPPFR